MANSLPYELEEVTDILIDGMGDFTSIKHGSLQEAGDGTTSVFGMTAIDEFSGAHIFFFGSRLIAVMYRKTGEEVATVTSMDRVLP